VNFAFQALAIIALVLPGIILKNAYRNGFFWSRPRQLAPVAEEVVYSLLLASALHGAYGWLVSHWYAIDLGAVAAILLGQYGKDGELLPRTLDALTGHPARMFFYFAGLYSVSAGVGLLAHRTVRGLHWDRKFRFLRFNHQWHYLLRGELASFPESNVKVQSFDFISLACVADIDAGSFLYVGVLDAFYFDKVGELDLLVLTGAMRRPIDPARENGAGGRPDSFFIDAEYLYLKYSEVKNVSIRYVTLPTEDFEDQLQREMAATADFEWPRP
jgi:hypothetical protein